MSFVQLESSQLSRCRLQTGRGYDVCQWNDSMMWCSWGISPASKSPTLHKEDVIHHNLPKGASRFHRLLAFGREGAGGGANMRLAGSFWNWATTFVVLSWWFGAASRTVFRPRNPSNQTVIVGQSRSRPPLALVPWLNIPLGWKRLDCGWLVIIFADVPVRMRSDSLPRLVALVGGGGV